MDDDDDDDNNDSEDDNYFAAPKKCNNNVGKRKHIRKMTINPDFVLGADFENEERADVDDEEGGDDGMDDDNGPLVEPKKHGLTMSKD